MKNQILINGERFILRNTDTKTGQAIRNIGLSKCTTYYYYDSIYTAYEKPSERKVNIWEYWKSWFDGVKGSNKKMWICSKNCNFFSIAFSYRQNGYTVNGYITASRQEVVYV